MSKVVYVEQVTPWKRALNAARQTAGKKRLDKDPSNKWKAEMLLAEHSPIRLVEYDWTWNDIKQWVTAHLVRHHEGCEKFVHTQRPSRNSAIHDRDSLPQGTLNEMAMSANAQALINISRKRLCACASKDTRDAWMQVKKAIAEIDPIMASKMVPECLYRGFCPEFRDSCGYADTEQFQVDLKQYRATNYE